MVETTGIYQGELHCDLTHGPSGNVISTDAPADNQGKGEAFSPTDLVAAALGGCTLTILGIVARRHNVDVTGATVSVQKEMTPQPNRRIGKLITRIRVPVTPTPEFRTLAENAIHTCPVHKSLHPDIEAPIVVEWGEG